MKTTSTSSAPVLAPTATKSTLARLLAAENIHVLHEAVPTASFDLKSRILRLPVWSGASVQLYDMLVGHEVAHALWTPQDGWRDGITAIAATVGCPRETAASYLNIVEDARIERMIQQKFRGLRGDFLAGYKTLQDRKFFGDISNPNTLCFADRVNLHFKLGVHIGTLVQFNTVEAAIVARIDAANDWDTVVAIATDMARLGTTKKEAAPQEEQQESSTSPAEQGADGEDGEDEGEEGAQVEPSADGEESEENEDGTGSAGVEGEDGEDGEGAGDDTDSTPTKETTDAEGSGSAPTSAKGEEQSDTSAPESTTEEPKTNAAMERALAEMAKVQPYEVSEVVRVQMPKANSTTIDYTEILQMMRNHPSMSAIMAQPTRIADYNTAAVTMATAFNRRKAADAWRRTSIAKTGSLDTLRMNQYLWNEDIFRRTTRTADGKNHGIVILLDWSGSMSGIMQSTMGQLFILADFCRKCGVPFEVYGFSDMPWIDIKGKDQYSPEVQKARQECEAKNAELRKNDLVQLRPVVMLNLLSNRMSGTDYEAAKTCLWNWRRMGQADARMSLNGTPTTSALIAAADLVSAFIARNGVQITHTIVLTDGEPTDRMEFNDFLWMKNTEKTGYSTAGSRAVVLSDPRTGASYDMNTVWKRGSYGQEAHQYGSVSVSNTSGHKHSMIAVDALRQRTGSKVHWLGLCDGNSRSAGRAESYHMTPAPKSDWTRNGFIRGEVAGWDSAVIIDSSRFARESNGSISISANKAIEKAEDKMEKATTNRALTSAFIDSQIAQGSLRTVANIVGEYLAV